MFELMLFKFKISAGWLSIVSVSDLFGTTSEFLFKLNIFLKNEEGLLVDVVTEADDNDEEVNAAASDKLFRLFVSAAICSDELDSVRMGDDMISVVTRRCTFKVE